MELLADSFDRKEHRERLFKVMEQYLKTDSEKNLVPVVFIKGGEQTTRYDSDQDISFHQDSNFFFLSGLNEPDCYIALNLVTKKTVLFAPELDDGYALWCGDYPSKEDYIKKINVDEVCWTNKMENFLFDDWKVNKFYVLKTIPSQISKWMSEKNVEVDSKNLQIEIARLRVIKTQSELDFQRKACSITAQAHKFVMENVKTGIYEYEAAANLSYYGYKNYGAKHQAFMTIAASGFYPSTLHYIRNNRKTEEGDLLLLDGGSYFEGYCGDVTRTYPVNGKYSEKQKAIYNIVLKANEVVIESVKPGIQWEDMHILSEKVIAEGLLNLGILKGDLKEILENHVQASFYPHGLGHSLGLDTHDLVEPFEKINRPSLGFLRIRTVLKPGMVLTVEPGIYFNSRMLNNAKKNEKVSKYINWEKIEKENWLKFGGVRIEDDIIITENGCEVMTSEVPKKVEEIEKLIADHKLKQVA